MNDSSKRIAQLMRTLQRVPYLASKNLYRVVDYFLALDTQELHHFCAVLNECKAQVVRCLTCMVWKDAEEACGFCGNTKRDQAVICVVESWNDVMLIERTGAFTGCYHVLGGLICPLEGVTAQDLFIDALVERIVEGKRCKEVLFALSQNPEGEVTAAYIAHRLAKTDVRVSVIARGLPAGSSLETADRVTLFKALSERRPF